MQAAEQKKKKLTPAEVYYHQRKIDEIWGELVAFQNEINNQQERVRDLAKHYKALIESGVTENIPEAINDTCAFICHRKDELNITITDQWIRNALDPEFKHVEFGNKPAVGESTFGSEQVELPNINKIVDNAGLEQAYEQTSKVEEYARNLARLARDAKAELEEKADKNHFQLPNSKGDSKSTPKPESRETDLSDELMFLSEDILAVREKVIEFPPEPEDAKEWASGIRDFRMMFKGHIDEKYSKSIPEWFRVQITNIQSGKHAAAVKHATMLPGGIKRNLTREQVGDNAEFILDAAWKVLNSFGGLAGLIAHHTKYVEPHVAQRKADLSPVLSEKA